LRRDDSGEIQTTSGGNIMSLQHFLDKLPEQAFNEYDGSYHGWVVQEYIQQHEDITRISPYTVNTVRVVTFLTAENIVEIHFTIIRLGRKGNAGDNWATGGLSVGIDQTTGIMGPGVLKPKYGGEWLSKHPDSGELIEGIQIPHWNEIISLCKRAATQFSGIRSIGWDIAVTQDGPVIVEGNGDWDLAMVQAHLKPGFLSPQVIAQLAKFNCDFAQSLPSPLLSFWRLTKKRVKQSRFGKYFQ
jgi:hypothetical protein